MELVGEVKREVKVVVAQRVLGPRGSPGIDLATREEIEHLFGERPAGVGKAFPVPRRRSIEHQITHGPSEKRDTRAGDFLLGPTG
jgi:hypothetical protein